MTKHLFILLVISFLGTQEGWSQEVPKKIVVEHFTNSRCSVCASRNPGFYSALDQNPEVIHIAFHPSSPYSTCLFSTQNKVENDARTNWYGLFGGTPTFAINGTPKNINEVSNASDYQPYKGKTTPIDVVVTIKPFGTDSMEVNAVITSVANHSLSNLQLYVALAEDTVFYNSPNGEKIHQDVFRKSFTGNNPIAISLGNQQSNKVEYSKKIKKNSIWDLKRCYALALLQDNNKNLVQAGVSKLYNENIVSSTQDEKFSAENLLVYPNPAQDFVNVRLKNGEQIKSIEILDQLGALIKTYHVQKQEATLDISSIESGLFLVKCVTIDGQTVIKKVFKK